MAKAKRRRVRDTWKAKEWYTILTPVEFGEKEIGTTPASEPEQLIGRRVEATMRELTGEYNKQYVKLQFEISEVTGKTAKTKFILQKTTTDYVRSMIRRGTTRIDAPTIITTPEGHKIKIHVIAITVRRAKSSQKKYMRERISEIITEVTADKPFKELIDYIITGKLASEVYHNAKKVYPLKRVETVKTKLLE